MTQTCPVHHRPETVAGDGRKRAGAADQTAALPRLPTRAAPPMDPAATGRRLAQPRLRWLGQGPAARCAIRPESLPEGPRRAAPPARRLSKEDANDRIRAPVSTRLWRTRWAGHCFIPRGKARWPRSSCWRSFFARCDRRAPATPGPAPPCPAYSLRIPANTQTGRFRARRQANGRGLKRPVHCAAACSASREGPLSQPVIPQAAGRPAAPFRPGDGRDAPSSSR